MFKTDLKGNTNNHKSIVSGASVTRNVRLTNTREAKKLPACLSTKTVKVQMEKYFNKMTVATSMKKVCYWKFNYQNVVHWQNVFKYINL